MAENEELNEKQKQEELEESEDNFPLPDGEEPPPPKKEPSGLYKAISKIFFLFLLGSLGVATFLSVLTLDFLDLYQFRYNIPEPWRKQWPLNAYYDFVQLHQLPEEERYQQLIIKEQQRYDRIITQGSKELEERSKALEESYKNLIRSQKERYNSSMEELRKQQEDFLKEKKAFEETSKDLDVRKEAIDELSKQLASEALNVESSLIKFMEEENKMKQVQTIAEAMDPRSLGTIFDEVTDDQLIYDIIRGLSPIQAGKVLSTMDPEKAGKIMKLGQNQIKLPPPGGPSRSYIPPSLQGLIASSQAQLR
jgi:flagellar motility protein MotE (MotC chaperone)